MSVVAETVRSGAVALRAYAAGDPGSPAIVLASACGMPAGLCEPWLRRLSARHFAVTWETRALFGELGDPAAFDALDCGVDAQAADLAAVMDHYGIERAHAMGMCGGAVIALRAAARQPDRIASLSLWHGDFSGTPAPRTAHQENLRVLLDLAARGRADAEAINSALAESTTARVPQEVADLVGYPYSSTELFYRYCVLTGATMTYDVTGLLPAIDQPTLVVTSEDDHTAHPAGSGRVAAALSAARLCVEPHGDHISVFAASDRLAELLEGFLAEAPAPLAA